MRFLVRRLVFVLLATIAIIGPGGCGNPPEPINPELKVPDVPKSSSGGSKKTPNKK
jgi:hypothetical protein